jgi:hypothetical protein
VAERGRRFGQRFEQCTKEVRHNNAGADKAFPRAQCAQETNKGEYYTEQDFGDKTYFDRMYEGRSKIGNIYPGDGKKFIGGGAIHITEGTSIKNSPTMSATRK